MKGAAIELAPRGVTVNNIQPGPTTTDMTKEHTERVLPFIPLGRMGKTRERSRGRSPIWRARRQVSPAPA